MNAEVFERLAALERRVAALEVHPVSSAGAAGTTSILGKMTVPGSGHAVQIVDRRSKIAPISVETHDALTTVTIVDPS